MAEVKPPEATKEEGEEKKEEQKPGENAEGDKEEKDPMAEGDWEKQLIEEPPPVEEPVSACKTLWLRSRGMLFALISILCQTFQNYLIFRMLTDAEYQGVGYNAFLMILVRFIPVFFLSLFLIPIHQCGLKENVFENVWPISGKTTYLAHLFMFLRSSAAIIVMIAHFVAYMFVTPGEVATIVATHIIFVAICARMFLKEPLTIYQLCVSVIAIIGVVLVTRIPYMIERAEHPLHTPANCTEKHNCPHEIPIETRLKGFGLAILGMLGVTMATLILRVLRNVHYVAININMGFLGSIFGVIVTAAIGGYISPNRTATEYVMLIVIGFFAWLAHVLQTLSLFYESAGPIAVMRSTEVIFSFLFQMWSNKYPDGMQIGGAVLVVLCVVLVGFQKYMMEKPDDNPLKMKLWWMFK